jgi:hypothetical protein
VEKGWEMTRSILICSNFLTVYNQRRLTLDPQQKIGPLALCEFRDEYLPSIGFQPLGQTHRGVTWMVKNYCSVKLRTNTDTDAIELCLIPPVLEVGKRRVQSDHVVITAPTWEDWYKLMDLFELNSWLDNEPVASDYLGQVE